MTITIFGVVVLLIGCLLLVRGSKVAMLSFVMLMSLMSGAGAFVLTGLGGSTVPPAAAAMPFLIVRCLLPGQQNSALGDAVRANLWLVLFCLYGSFSAYVLPRIFAGAISVTPLRPIPTGDPFVTFPLAFSAQNMTVSAYLLLTMMAGICAYSVSRTSGAARRIARMAAIVAILHATFGFASVLFAGTPLAAVLEFFRNGFYAQLDQTVSGLVRMNGIAPEPSGYASFGFIYFVLNTELWLRDVDVRWTRFASLFLGSALLMSTSSTAYVGLGGYAIIAGLRAMAFPGSVSLVKSLALASLVLIAAIGVVIVLIAMPELADVVGRVATRVLLEKGDTLSGEQRMFWALQGFHAFWSTGGLGIGMGSFRSSSILTAILGSTGAIGILTYFAHLLRVFQPLRQSTYGVGGGLEQRLGVAASWTVVAIVIPAAATAATPDPGMIWGMLGGLALGFRTNVEAFHKVSDHV